MTWVCIVRTCRPRKNIENLGTWAGSRLALVAGVLPSFVDSGDSYVHNDCLMRMPGLKDRQLLRVPNIPIKKAWREAQDQNVTKTNLRPCHDRHFVDNEAVSVTQLCLNMLPLPSQHVDSEIIHFFEEGRIALLMWMSSWKKLHEQIRIQY